MTELTVEPAEFTLVDYDADVIRTTIEKLVTDIGLGVDRLVVEVDEGSPLGRASVESTDPLHLKFEGGAFEDPKRPRKLGRGAVVDAVGGQLLLHKDRTDPAFGAPDDEDDLELAYKVAWRIYAAARLARLGYRAQRQRRLYQFRNRCGFTDAADEAFDVLWDREDLTWADITGAVDGALEFREAARAG